MNFIQTKIKGLFIIEPELREDERGYFTRIFCKKELLKIGVKYNIVQINRSLTVVKGTIRGLHYQKNPRAEDKIIQCIQGKIFDVALDLRKNSKTFGKWFGLEISSVNKKMLLVPKGFAHGFQTLEKKSIVQYFVSEYYSPEYESGIRWNDPRFNFKWPVKSPKISKKDSNWPLFV